VSALIPTGWSRSAGIRSTRPPPAKHTSRRPRCSISGTAKTFEIPAGAVHLAHNDAFDAQAFRYDRHVYGIEFHPEMTLAMIERWTASEKGAPMLTLPGAQPREAQLEAFQRYVSASDRWLGRFLDERLLCPGARAPEGAA
jgi:GMP synthase (glutamine-hydrolysing)